VSQSGGFCISEVEPWVSSTKVIVVEATFVIGEHGSSYIRVYITGQASSQSSSRIFTVVVL
jgi:hypothetical protein